MLLCNLCQTSTRIVCVVPICIYSNAALKEKTILLRQFWILYLIKRISYANSWLEYPPFGGENLISSLVYIKTLLLINLLSKYSCFRIFTCVSPIVSWKYNNTSPRNGDTFVDNVAVRICIYIRWYENSSLLKALRFIIISYITVCRSSYLCKNYSNLKCNATWFHLISLLFIQSSF
jgi:hypothetical protein